MKPYLRIKVEVLPEFVAPEDALIYTNNRIYEAKAALDPRYHSFLTMEILDMIKACRDGVKGEL